MTNRPYTAIVKKADGKEELLDLSEKGWKKRLDTDSFLRFTLKPKDKNSAFSSITIDLAPLSGGEEKRLVYFVRVFNRLAAQQGNGSMALFSLYCVGWQATVNGKNIKSLNWIYPDGSIVSAEEPLFVEELMDYFWQKQLGGSSRSNGAAKKLP